MSKKLWINLPIKDPKKSKEFFTALGFTFNTKYDSDDGALSLMVGDNQTIVMLFPETSFKAFTGADTADTGQAAEVLLSLGAESREEVDEVARKAVEAGGKVFSKPGEKGGWMYGCGFADPDGHRWNMLYMDTSKIQNTL